MKANDDILAAFHGFSAAMRMDLLCRLFHQCMPLEIRFLWTVLNELALKSYEALTPVETKLNRLEYFGRMNSVHEDPQKVCMSMALLRSDNHTLATLLLRLLSADGVIPECQRIGNLEQLEEYRLMYVMALQHPAFHFYSKLQQLGQCSKELEQLLDEKMSLWKTQGEAAGAETIMIKGPQVLPIPPAGSTLHTCEVMGVYKRISDKRFVYSIHVVWSDSTTYTIYRPYGEFFTFQSQLLDLFPDEAGGKKNKKSRVIPFLPGKRFPFSSINSKEKAEKRFPEIVKYVRALMGLPPYITEHTHVRAFFAPHPQDHLLEETIFEKVKTVPDCVRDVDYAMTLDRRSCSLNHEQTQTKTAKDRSRTFPSSAMTEHYLTANNKRMFTGSTSIEFTTNPLSPASNPPSTPVLLDSQTDHAEQVFSALHQSGDGLSSIPENNLQQTQPSASVQDYSLASESLMLHTDDSGVNTLSSLSTPGIATRGVSSDTISTGSSITGSPSMSPLATPDMQKRSESCLTIHTDSQFTEDTFVHWLKNHRLHKYAALFRGRTLEQILSMQVEDLRKGGMTVGATRKFQKKINEWRTHLAHCTSGSLQQVIPRHPSTFSLPSYLVDRGGGGIMGSASNQSLDRATTTEGTLSMRRRVASTTSSTSDATADGSSLLEAPHTLGGGICDNDAVVISESFSSPGQFGEQKKLYFAHRTDELRAEDDGRILLSGEKESSSVPSLSSSSHSAGQDTNPVSSEPGWNASTATYYSSAAPSPVYPGKRFNPSPVQIQVGNGTGGGATLNGQGGGLEGVVGVGVPHQQAPPPHVPGGYGYYPRTVPINSGHLLQMPTISTLNGTYIVMPQHQPFYRPYSGPLVGGAGVAAAQRPSCFKCGQFGHQGQECTGESMESFGTFHKSLNQQMSQSMPGSSSSSEANAGLEST